MAWKAKFIPVIVRATVTTSKSFRKYLSNVTGKDHSNELAKTAVLGTAYRIQKVLMQKYATFNKGNSITCTINCNHRTATTLYTLETRFVSGTQTGGRVNSELIKKNTSGPQYIKIYSK